ncbi:hypothetical protein SCHPADRAFT_911499 [Schizopora paradoxa]|uniref:Uncharacterized protein n=1 Tax=Schizopora paradoxa TaxID=27342 RepID=A0A0H2RIM7_9AGAM|nr:hypothetical protein SCHPADRAFT_911499 [Schizopora paradoxa]
MASELQLIVTFAMVVFASLFPFFEDQRLNKGQFPGSYEIDLDEDGVEDMDLDGDVIMHECDYISQLEWRLDPMIKQRDIREETVHHFSESVKTTVSGDVVMFDAEATHVAALEIFDDVDLWHETALFEDAVGSASSPCEDVRTV